MVEVAEIETRTEEALRNEMLGQCRAGMHEGWDESGRTEREIGACIYEFKAISPR